MQIFSDIINFIKTLSFVDIVFFFAVLALMLLIITLIYFLRENNDSDIEVNKSSDKKELSSDEAALLSLKELTEALENAEPKEVNLNRYEEEQEEKAIISYEELLNRKNDFAINYSEEENIDEELTIKKVDLDNLINKEVTEPQHISVTVISYDKEEAFLQALKTLQQTLN
ncbi:MAG: hypothetical protein HFI36_00995 [Bacilli bacterium]|nr:hypothetical protein [Bacilli bacterium]MCX4254161.1 hypothetical protein [Bacilli bacterium]